MCIRIVLRLLFLTVSRLISIVDAAIFNSLARERGFTVRDVPRDGDCLFSAVEMQLENIGVHVGDRNLREEHLQSHPYTRDGSSHLRDFVIADDDYLNADTEAPSEPDEYITSIEDPDLRQQLRWLWYLERLNAGAWGNHIAVQGLADMLHVDICIISTINPDMDLIKTSHPTSTGLVQMEDLPGISSTC